VTRRVICRQLVHQLDIAIRASIESGSVFRCASRTNHGCLRLLVQVYD
jgi:hypothetical protein